MLQQWSLTYEGRIADSRNVEGRWIYLDNAPAFWKLVAFPVIYLAFNYMWEYWGATRDDKNV